MRPTIAVLVEFVAGTRLRRGEKTASQLQILANGPPGTFIVFPDGTEVPLPTDQIVLAEDGQGHARVGFGGMRFHALEAGQLVFYRVRDLRPESELSPERGMRMTLEPPMVSVVLQDDEIAWSAKQDWN